MHYALPKGDEGTAVQITYGMGNYASATTVTLSKAHDVPVRGQENDRVKRMESYVKDFKPISMGMLKLSPRRHRTRTGNILNKHDVLCVSVVSK